MAVRLDNCQDGFEAGFATLLASKREATVDVADTVSSIIADVRARGDAALLELTAKFKIDEKYIATSLYLNFIKMNVIFFLINLNKIIVGS